MKTLYSTTATTAGGREGHVTSDDGNLDLELSMPESLGGKGGNKTNPEQLFAAAYSASFGNALQRVAQKEAIDMGSFSVTASVEIGKMEEGGMGLAVTLDCILPGIEVEAGEKLVNEAYEVCPYSLATMDNIDVTLNLILDEDEEE
ncbi:MAG: organic hydroperoxide resistance protein [Salinimicrobium sp.]